MVTDLFKVLKWCEEKKRHEFRKKDIEHLLSKSVQANFAYWRWFGGLVYNPDGIQGHYGLNIERCKEFFAGRLEIPTTLYKNPLDKNEETSIRKGDPATIDKIPNLLSFLDENETYISVYRNPIIKDSNGQTKLF